MLPSKALKRASKDHHEGQRLFEQKAYGKAEQLFRQVASTYEQFGAKELDILSNKKWLGRTLGRQEKHHEAEMLLRQVAQGHERLLGAQDGKTIRSKYFLGVTLYRQGKNDEAEGLFRQIIRGHEVVFGIEGRRTLDSKYMYGKILQAQKKFREAETALRQVVQAEEKSTDTRLEDVLSSKHALGLTLFQLEEYSEAEKLVRETVEAREAAPGQKIENLMVGKLCLGRTLYCLRKYGEAERLLVEAYEGHKASLGVGDEKTLDCLRWLERARQDVARVRKVEVASEEAAVERVEALDLDALRIVEPVHAEAPLELTWPVPANETPGASGQLAAFFLARDKGSEPYTEHEVNQISKLLHEINSEWSTSPRTYIILRVINQLSIFNDLLHLGFSDYWLPATERSLPSLVPHSSRALFISTQKLALTKSFCVEKGSHCHFAAGESLPFTTVKVLGTGAYGLVDKISSTLTSKCYARKRVLRSAAFRGPKKEHTKQFIAEIEILKRLQHHHIVELVGSYTDPKYIALLMLPVASHDLTTYLQTATAASHPQLRTFFGCLASALAYLHEQKIRHKDIKPSNILVERGTVLFADFGLALDFEDASGGSVTTGMVNGRTPRYCAPEVADLEPRNTKSDIWSLGVVFLEMVVRLKGWAVKDMDSFFETHGSRQMFVRTNVGALAGFLDVLRGREGAGDNVALRWTQQMLSVEQQARPAASALLMWIRAEEGEQEGEQETRFCGVCCGPHEEQFSDAGSE